MIQFNNSKSLERLESGIQVPLTKKIPESSTWNLETTAWNPESKTVSYSVEKSLRHVAMDAKFLDLNKPWSCKYGKKKKNEKIDMYDFPVHDCTREQKVVLFFYRSTMQMAVLQLVSVKKYCWDLEILLPW